MSLWTSLLLAFSLPSGQELGSIVVAAGDLERQDAIASIELKPAMAGMPLRLFEVQGDERTEIPCQVERGELARLWWVMSGETAAGGERHFALESGAPMRKDGLSLVTDDRDLTIRRDDQDVLVYHHGFVAPPEGVHESFLRNAYIHPLSSPSGRMLTEDFPADHFHHKGVWFPWTRTEFQGKKVDFWNLREQQGTVRFVEYAGQWSGSVFAGFRAKHEHVVFADKGETVPALNETWDVRVWNVGGDEYSLFDLEVRQRCAGESPLKQQRYHYGGLGFRGAKGWKGEDYLAVTSEGKTHLDGHQTRAKWCGHSGPVDGEWAAVVILCDPSNFRFPEPMRMWNQGGAFFCYCPSQLGEWSIEPDQEHHVRYRFVLQDGRIEREQSERLWQDFAHPVKARWSK
ncbi:MAG: PmoA family protein [Planctomycetota bacterium]